MSILIFAIVVLLIAGLLVWAVDYLPLGNPFNGVAKFLIILLAVLVIAQRAGVLA